MKLFRKVKHIETQRKEGKKKQKTTGHKSDNTAKRNKSKDKGERRKTQKILREDQTVQTKQDIPK